MRAGTAIGAMYREAEQAESRADFIHKLGIAQKECNEVIYWLELLYVTRFLNMKVFKRLFEDALELIKLLTAILKSSKNKR